MINKKTRSDEYQHPEILVELFRSDHIITVSGLFLIDSGYGDEINW